MSSMWLSDEMDQFDGYLGANNRLDKVTDVWAVIGVAAFVCAVISIPFFF